MKANELRKTFAQLEQLLQSDVNLQIEGSGGTFEVTVFYWDPTESRDTHFHVMGTTIPDVVNRAYSRAVESLIITPVD